jgi:NAD(P)-dependent dehydrogenase (short-subunit alcohol dehydrogenase family)
MSLPAAYSSLSLNGKVVFITGGSSGIGESTAKLFAVRGAKVVIAARREEQSLQVVKDIINQGGEAIFVKCDVTVESDVKNAIDEAVSKYGRIDVAFNNSGKMGPHGSTHEQTAESLMEVLDTNVKGVYICMKHEIIQFQKQLKDAGSFDVTKLDHHIQPNDYYKQATRYSIINNASIFGEVGGLSMYSAYAASKHAVVGLSKSASKEYASQGIRINTVNYGFVVSEITGSKPSMIDFMLTKVPAGRLGQGSEAAEAVAWLASDASSFVTGSSIRCDGGVAACVM